MTNIFVLEHTLRHLERDTLYVLSCDTASQCSCHIMHIDYYMRTSSYPSMKKADESAVCTIHRRLQRVWGRLFMCVLSQDGCPDYSTVSKNGNSWTQYVYSERMLALIVPFLVSLWIDVLWAGDHKGPPTVHSTALTPTGKEKQPTKLYAARSASCSIGYGNGACVLRRGCRQ